LLTGDTSKRFVSAGRYEVSRRSASGLPTWNVEPVTPHQYVPTIVPYDIHTSFVVPAFLLEKLMESYNSFLVYIRSIHDQNTILVVTPYLNHHFSY
jgi:hypothetical protein